MRQFKWLIKHALAAVVLSVTGSTAVFAMGLQVAPIVFVLTPAKAVDSLWLSNSNAITVATPITAQVRVYRWSQKDNQDVLTPTDDLIVSPPSIKIPSAGRQLVRVIRNTATIDPSIPEETYRIVVNELPVAAEGETGVKFVVEQSIPVFFQTASSDVLKHDLTVTLKPDADGVSFVFVNQGNEHAQIGAITYIDAQNKSTPIQGGLVGYVLANSERSWVMKFPAKLFNSGGSLQIKVNGKDKTFPVGVSSK